MFFPEYFNKYLVVGYRKKIKAIEPHRDISWLPIWDSSAMDVSAMVVANVLYEKSVFFKYFKLYTTKDVCLISALLSS